MLFSGWHITSQRLGLYFAQLKKSITFLKRKSEVNYRLGKNFRSILRISLPTFPFEFSVEQASNRMIDIKGLIKVLKQIQLSFIVLLFHLQKYEKL